MLSSILREDHQEVAACRNLYLFAGEGREGSCLNRELSALFKVSTLADGGAHHAQLATQISLEAFFIGSMQAAAIFHHISQELVSLCCFGSIKACLYLAVNLFQHLATIGFDKALLGPVISIFLHKKAHVASLILNLLSSLANLVPGFGRIIGIEACFSKNFRIVVQHRYTYGIRQADLLAILGLCQIQNIGQEIILHKVFVPCFLEGFI